jgi:SAM-dependent methyltransferase
MDLFAQQWASYRAVVGHDLMEHQAVTNATATALEQWLAARPAKAAAPQMVDLGCGDLALLAPVLQRLPLGRYTGLDLTPQVLPLAQQALGEVAYPCDWIEGDLLRWATDDATDDAGPGRGTDSDPTDSDRVDIVHSAFAIHHLRDSDKQLLLESMRRRIAPGGLFLWVDVFRKPGESRDDYVQRYLERVASGWQPLTAAQREHVGHHLATYDMPADREAIVAAATAAGWRWRWAWQGQHQAEALAVLEPG